MHKIYFYDNGLLNTLLQNYNALALRGTQEPCLKTFHLGKNEGKSLHGTLGDVYFWRSKTGRSGLH